MKALIVITILLLISNGLTFRYAAALRAKLREAETEVGTALTRLNSVKTQIEVQSLDMAKGGLDWVTNRLAAVKHRL